MKAQVTEVTKTNDLNSTLEQSTPNSLSITSISRRLNAKGLRPSRSILRSKMLRPKSCFPKAILKSKSE